MSDPTPDDGLATDPGYELGVHNDASADRVVNVTISGPGESDRIVFEESVLVRRQADVKREFRVPVAGQYDVTVAVEGGPVVTHEWSIERPNPRVALLVVVQDERVAFARFSTGLR